jgi:hypothetical protein
MLIESVQELDIRRAIVSKEQIMLMYVEQQPKSHRESIA